MNPKRPEARRRFPRGAALTGLAVLAAAAAYYFYANFVDRPSADVYVAQRGTAISAVYGTVTLASVQTLNVFSQNTGYLRLAPGLGSVVTSQGVILKRDQLLGTIVDEAGIRSLNQARTDFEAAMGRQRLGPTTLGLLESARQRLAAYDKLPNKSSVPRVDYEAAQNEVSRLTAAVENEKLEFQRQVDLAASNVKGLEDTLKRAEVRSPMDGVLIGQTYNDNAYVTLNALLFTVADSRTYVSGQVNEEDVGKLKEGMKAELRLYAYSNQNFTATLTAVLPSPDPNSQRYTVTLNQDDPPDNVRIGLTGEMNIILGKKENALTIPARALLVDQVLIVVDGTVEQRTVKTGFKSLELVEVTDGLEDGSQVIVADQDAFRPGERVRPIRTNESKPQGPAKKPAR